MDIEREGVFNSGSGRAAGDRVGGGTTNSTIERDRTRSLLRQLGSDGNRIDGGNNLEHGLKRPIVGLGSGSAASPDARAGIGAARPPAGQGEQYCAVHVFRNFTSLAFVARLWYIQDTSACSVCVLILSSVLALVAMLLLWLS
jgi:hypothetical protein